MVSALVPAQVASSLCGFTFAHYRSILERALNSGYLFYDHLTYWRQRPQEKSILLRHYIYNHLNRAVEFA
jgi:hypothetical protein